MTQQRFVFHAVHEIPAAYWSWRDEVLPNHAELMEAYMLLSPDSARERFLGDFPELAEFWAQADELFPQHSEQARQYALLSDDLKAAYRQAHR